MQKAPPLNSNSSKQSMRRSAKFSYTKKPQISWIYLKWFKPNWLIQNPNITKQAKLQKVTQTQIEELRKRLKLTLLAETGSLSGIIQDR